MISKEEKRVYNRVYMKEYKKKYLERLKLDSIRYKEYCEKQKGYRVRSRWEVLSVYSEGDLSCKCCGEKEYKFLTIDHINNDGAEERRRYSTARSGGGWFYALKKRGYPKGYQVLCYNCNCAKGRYGICPHQEK